MDTYDRLFCIRISCGKHKIVLYPRRPIFITKNVCINRELNLSTSEWSVYIYIPARLPRRLYGPQLFHIFIFHMIFMGVSNDFQEVVITRFYDFPSFHTTFTYIVQSSTRTKLEIEDVHVQTSQITVTVTKAHTTLQYNLTSIVSTKEQFQSDINLYSYPYPRLDTPQVTSEEKQEGRNKHICAQTGWRQTISGL